MFLSDIDIREAVRAGDITLKPFDAKRLQPASYDIRLGNVFQLSDLYATSFIDPVKRVYGKTREMKVPDGDEFILRPGVSVLATSKEFFGSDHYLIQLSGKSSLARVGLMVHNTAGIINPGHFLHITLELTNQNIVPIVLRPGMEIAQLTFSLLSSPPKQNYRKNGRYAKNNWRHFVSAKSKNKESRKRKKK